ncbi:MAG: LacI family DNA-binding transcriptional regulator [Wenzhouxiangellaceae bacterium]|nr:LacI family DNA-binding transcriptional regulator [Wenzhouxiangellaceae bacterium]
MNEPHEKRSPRGRPNSLDIAYQAGVSQATVSRALRGSPLVSEATRLRVVEIARELNYKVDKSASNLRTQRSDTLALLLFEDPTGDGPAINPFFLSMLASITRSCAAVKQDLLVSFQQLSDDWQADYENTHKADGLILLGYGDFIEYQSKLDRLNRHGGHFVRWGSAQGAQPGLTIGCDNVLGGLEMTRHLVSLDRRRIAFIGTQTKQYPEFRDRYAGYCKALKQTGIEIRPELQIEAITTERSGFEAMNRLIEQGAHFDAVFGASDLISIGAMQALLEKGYDIPGQVSIAGFDDIPAAAYARRPLTTIQQDTRRAGAILVESLLHLINDEPVSGRMIPGKLVVRGSCGARPAKA